MVPFGDKPVAKVRTEESGSAGNKDAWSGHYVVSMYEI
jgi:hypothetical protein